MRRKDRQTTDPDAILAIVAGCDVCRIALNGDDGMPYIVPLNFGYEAGEGGALTLYFHSATEGTKNRLIAADPRAVFEMDRGHRLLSSEERGYCTMNYESVIGRGTIRPVVDDAERLRALTLLTDRYHGGRRFAFSRAALPRTAVWRLDVDSLTAKTKASEV